MSWVIYDYSHMFICLLWFCHRLPKGEIVRAYVIYLLGTYVTILCNWLIFWQNALFLYLGRSRMYLILQETCFKIICWSHASLSNIQAEKCKFIKVRQLAQQLVSIEFEELFQSYGSTAARQIGYLLRFMKNKFSILFCIQSVYICLDFLFSQP